MGMTLLGTKLGMTRRYTEEGVSVPVTVLQVGPCYVTQIKRPETDGYAAIQIGYGDVKPRRSSMPMIGHDAKAGVAPRRRHHEFRVEETELDEYELGQMLSVADLQSLAFVDVSGISKGKGFQGVMKRHNFRGHEASHGIERKHRSPGSIGGGATNLGTGPKLKKGKRMAGQMGAKRATSRALEILQVIPDQNIMLVKGATPGPNQGAIEVRTPTRLYRGKARRQREAAKAAG